MIVVSNTSPLTSLASIRQFDLLKEQYQKLHIAAQRHGLRTLGVVGILLEAKATGRIDQLRPQLDSLKHYAGFFLSEEFYREALRLADESPQGSKPAGDEGPG